MKKIINLFLLAASFTIVASCTDGLDTLNKSQTGIVTLDPVFVLNGAIVNSSPPAGTLQYELAIVQQIITSNSGVNVGGNFNQVNIGATPAMWTNYYQNVIKNTTDVITRTKDDAGRSNLYNMARIVQAGAFMVLTDTYGSVPYSEAGQGFTNLTFFPKYDAQQSIYGGIISELTAATAALSASGKIETGDALFIGDITKWKKFGYSLLLRAGMRLTKADPAKAAATALAAYAGVILTNADNAIIKHDANFINGVGNTLNGTEAANFYLTDTFVNTLKSTNDPRLSAIAVRFVGANSGTAQVYTTSGSSIKNSTTVAAEQYGMPMGSTDGTADAAGATLIGGGNRYAFSQADRTRVIKRTSANFIITASQTNLLLAEAAFRGYIPGSAAGYYAEGIRQHMDQMALYDAAAAVSTANRDAYVAANPLTPGTELQQINTQYWISSFLMGSEGWANVRRSGFPVLPVNPFAGKTVPFITRLTYPPSEILVNGSSVQAAIAAQGADALNTKVYWDK